MFTRVGGIGAGVVVGTPIAVVRESVKSYIDLTQGAADSVGEKMGGMNGMGGMSGYNPMGYGGMPLNMGGGGPSGFMW